MTERLSTAGGGAPASLAAPGAPRRYPIEFRPEATPGPSCDLGRHVRQRALVLWPRLDPVRLARTAGDPERVARLVGQRSTLPPEAIVGMLLAAGDLD